MNHNRFAKSEVAGIKVSVVDRRAKVKQSIVSPDTLRATKHRQSRSLAFFLELLETAPQLYKSRDDLIDC